MPPEPPRSIETEGLADPGIFGTGIMHWIFLAVVVLLLLTAIVVWLRARRHRGRLAKGEDHPEIRSTDH